MRKRLWSPDEDEKLQKYVSQHGFGNWSEVAKKTGLQRCGKSCRLRWINYLRPDLKRGKFSAEEKLIIVNLQKVFGNSWSKIAAHLPGRTDSDIKNFWHSHFRKKRPQQLLSVASLMIPSVVHLEPTQYTSSCAEAYSNSASSYALHPNAVKVIARNPNTSLTPVMNPNPSCQHAAATFSSDFLPLLSASSGLSNTMKQESNNYMQILNHHLSSAFVPTSSTMGSSSPEDGSNNIAHLYDPSKQHGHQHGHQHQTPMNKVDDQLFGSLCPEATWYHGNKLHDVSFAGIARDDDQGNINLVNGDDNSKDSNALHMFMYGSMPHSDININVHASQDAPPPEGLDLVVWSCVNRPNSQLIDQELITPCTPNITMPNITHNTINTLEQAQFLELE